MAFPDKVKEDALVDCGRCCCICHAFCGVKIELHHIQLASEGGTDTADNCIPLCLSCHADQSSYDKKHPKGTKYTPGELRRHRDKWYQWVEEGRAPQEPQDPQQQRLRLDLKVSIMESASELRSLLLETLTQRREPTLLEKSRASDLWATLLAKFSAAIDSGWKPKRVNTSDDRMADFDREMGNFCRNGTPRGVEYIPRCIHEEVASWTV